LGLADRPAIVSSELVRGERRSVIVRADGSTFVVTVPAMGMDECADGIDWQHDWISDDGEPPPLSRFSLLHRAVVASPPEVAPTDRHRAERGLETL
jgi:hypothetical protein